ncbi:MAG TPA: hypothetical protein VJS64_09480 [Pyrinomonadaceae bacterium]|nr:hypothetical protein [Pyrinomonadaceae bacterium]
MYPSQKIVTVCSRCLTESCHQGFSPCAEAGAGSVTDTEEAIARMSISPIEAAAQGGIYEVQPASDKGLESIGPFMVHKLTLDGYQIPFLTGKIVDGRWYFTLDSRFGCDVPERDGAGVAMMIANALAFGAGFSCFGENSNPLNLFKTRMYGITMASDMEVMNATEQ